MLDSLDYVAYVAAGQTILTSIWREAFHTDKLIRLLRTFPHMQGQEGCSLLVFAFSCWLFAFSASNRSKLGVSHTIYSLFGQTFCSVHSPFALTYTKKFHNCLCTLAMNLTRHVESFLGADFFPSEGWDTFATSAHTECIHATALIPRSSIPDVSKTVTVTSHVSAQFGSCNLITIWNRYLHRENIESHKLCILVCLERNYL